MRRCAAFFLLWGCVRFAYAQQNGSHPGKRVFSQYCAFCHGIDATGAEGPNLILSSVVRHDKDGDLISPVIHNGRADKGMPPIALTPEQTSEVVAYLHERIKESDRRSAGKPNAGYSLERLNTGNAKAGAAFFAAKCMTCHSATGDLRGIANKYPPIELQTRMLYPQDVPETADIEPRGEAPVHGTVVYQDPFTIAILDRDGWYRSWAPEDAKVTIRDPLERHRELLGEYTEADLHNLFAYLETLR